MRLTVVAAALITWSLLDGAWASEIRYISADIVDVHLCPKSDCPVTNRLYRGQRVELFGNKDGWAQISLYYDASVERQEFPQLTSSLVARWVPLTSLSKEIPVGSSQPVFDIRLNDPRIEGIPAVGEFGLTEADVRKLREKAAELIETGACSGVEYGDKSVERTGYYFVLCVGENRNRFFK